MGCGQGCEVSRTFKAARLCVRSRQSPSGRMETLENSSRSVVLRARYSAGFSYGNNSVHQNMEFPVPTIASSILHEAMPRAALEYSILRSRLDALNEYRKSLLVPDYLKYFGASMRRCARLCGGPTKELARCLTFDGSSRRTFKMFLR